MNIATVTVPVVSAPPAVQTVRGACPHDCPDTCALKITVDNGRVI